MTSLSCKLRDHEHGMHGSSNVKINENSIKKFMNQ